MWPSAIAPRPMGTPLRLLGDAQSGISVKELKTTVPPPLCHPRLPDVLTFFLAWSRKTGVWGMSDVVDVVYIQYKLRDVPVDELNRRSPR